VIFSIPRPAGRAQHRRALHPLPGQRHAKDLTCTAPTPGLDLTGKADRPDMAAVFWGFRAMFYAALLMFASRLAHGVPDPLQRFIRSRATLSPGDVRSQV
jgi:cytochrome bd ubiquinol oxidase subunit I